MSKYAIIHGQFHEVSDDELMHWKYIKREKVNGKWVYTYKKPGDDKTTKSTEVKDTNRWGSSKSTVTIGKNKYVTYKRGKIERAIEAAKRKLGIKDYLDDRTKDWYESQDRMMEKHVEKAKKEGSDVNFTDKRHSSQTTITIGDDKYVTNNIGTRKLYFETAKEYLRDRLGYDEQENLQKAEEAKTKADENEQFTWDWMMDALGDLGTLARGNASKESIENARESLRIAQNYHDRDMIKKAVYGREYLNAKAEYMKTPLGKIEKLRDEVATDLEEAAKRIRGKKR